MEHRQRADLDQGLERLRAGAGMLVDRELEPFCDELIDRLGCAGDDAVVVLALRAHDESKPRPSVAGPERLS